MQYLLNKIGQPRKRALVGLMVVLALGSTVLILGARPDAASQSGSTAGPKPEAAYPLLNPPAADSLSSGTADFTTRELFFKTMLAVLLVAVLGFGTVFVSKRLLPKIAPTLCAGPGKEIRVVETTYLGPHKAIHLVEVSSYRLLLGSTNDSITTLAHLTDAWTDLSKQELNETVRP